MPLKARYMKKDLADWARSAGLAIKMPPTVFPVNSVKAMRGCIWLGKDMVPFARAVFEMYWGADKDISMYFGNDRMPLIREALHRLKARAA